MEMNDIEFVPDDLDMDFSTPDEINQVPYSREAEEAVLGAILINPEKYFDVAQIISGQDFYIHRNRWVWDAYGALFEKGQAIDVQTVCEELDAKGHLGEVGGKAFFYNLTSKTPSSMHAESYANIVLDKSQRRSLIEAGQKMMDNEYSDSHVVLDASSLPAGTYMVTVTTSTGKTTKKVIVR